MPTPRRVERFVIRAKLLLLLASIFVSVVGIELSLRMFTQFPIHDRDANRKNHDALGYVVDPELSDIDEFGFRNPEGTGVVDWVAIGDSFTYGFGVASEESWPAQLADRLKSPVYNYGVGGYGIVHYRWLFDRALERKPRAIVLALFLANDLADACKLAPMEYWKGELRERGLDFSHCDQTKRAMARDRSGPSDPPSLGSFTLSTAVGSALKELIWRPLQRYRHPERFVRVRYGQSETVLWKRRVGLHRRYTDITRPEIAVAVDALELFLDEMIEAARASSTRFGVLFVPSKENVFLESVDPRDPFYPKIERTVAQERELTEELERFLRERNVPRANALACLQARFAIRLYPEDANGHPRAPGYTCYAEAAEPLVQKPRSESP